MRTDELFKILDSKYPRDVIDYFIMGLLVMLIVGLTSLTGYAVFYYFKTAIRIFGVVLLFLFLGWVGFKVNDWWEDRFK